ncbi:unnamed protein product [Paramecium primaurelia]|uniref:Uncharacterized protein n=1 Tax=Paramecium primaurelia TaxID=5886 RepID=A0A8S1PUS4_PARPR|nr:unnamed protein product [Paramecium primaurelia]
MTVFQAIKQVVIPNEKFNSKKGAIKPKLLLKNQYYIVYSL